MHPQQRPVADGRRLLRAWGGDEAHCAGSEATIARPAAIAAMAELGIDISGHESKAVQRFLPHSDEPSEP